VARLRRIVVRFAMTVTDLYLAHQLERTEALSNKAFVIARAQLDPALGATWMTVAGGHALFDGIGSPLTQVFGLGLRDVPTEADLTRVESFFDTHGADTTIELCPLASTTLLQWLPARGYVPVELTSVLHRSLDAKEESAAHAKNTPQVRQITPDERAEWADRSAEGWATDPDFAAMIRELAWVNAHSAGMHCFVAEIDGRIIATGGLAIHDHVALLAGASTLPEFRGRGAQTALQTARLRFARDTGCTRAMQCAAPGSTSQVNAERQGFQIAYTRTKWQRSANHHERARITIPNANTATLYECWFDPADSGLALLRAQDVQRNRDGGQLSDDAVMQYSFIAHSGEEAMAIHALRQGWAPYLPMGEAAPCPTCGSMYYPNGYGDCWRCGKIG
jgi:GNAT superfamily N-acetyltransferase